jgi:hypothetical protein
VQLLCRTRSKTWQKTAQKDKNEKCMKVRSLVGKNLSSKLTDSTRSDFRRAEGGALYAIKSFESAKNHHDLTQQQKER